MYNVNKKKCNLILECINTIFIKIIPSIGRYSYNLKVNIGINIFYAECVVHFFRTASYFYENMNSSCGLINQLSIII